MGDGADTPNFLDSLPSRLPPPIADLDRAAGHVVDTRWCEEYAVRVAREYSLNPHGLTCYAEECRRALRLAERKLLELIGSSEREASVIWCANGTEALNLALRGFPFDETSPGGAVAFDAGGHHALTETARALERPLREVLVDYDGTARLQNAADNADSAASPVALAALTLVNSETGVIWDGDRAGLFPDTAHCRLLLDACQAFGKHPIPWERAHVDLLVISGRKIGGPATGAALVIRKPLQLKTLLYGGGQQNGLLSGTIDTTAALLFTAAAEAVCQNAAAALQRVRMLNRHLRTGLLALGGGKWVIFSPEETASPYILYFAIPGKQGALVARLLASHCRILVGTGSACTAESGETSETLRLLGVPDELARAAIRVSLAPETTQEEIDAFLDALPRVLKEY